MIAKSLNAGVVFSYGLMVDVSTRSIADLRRELNFITGTPEITVPSFVTLSIPLLGTPYFYECLKNGTILPDTKLRDMDGTTILQHPVDPMEEVVKFVDDLQSMRGLSGAGGEARDRIFETLSPQAYEDADDPGGRRRFAGLRPTANDVFLEFWLDEETTATAHLREQHGAS